jgi:RNA-binding protein YhbY
MRLGFRRRRRSAHVLRPVLALLVAGIVLAGCQEVPSNLVKSEPFKLEAIKGTDLNRVTLSDKVAARIDLQTVKVRRNGKRLMVPHEALIYNPFGKVFVYTRPEPRTYVRSPVIVNRVVGDHVVLSKGPAAGTTIVTVGAAELLATEYEILNQHP